MDRFELKALISLLDDDDPVVEQVVNEKLLAEGESIIPELQKYSLDRSNESLIGFIANKISFLETEFAIRQLIKIANTEYPDLQQGIFFINKLTDPEINLERYNSLFYQYSSDLLSEINEYHTAVEKLDIFHYILFNRLKFKCLIDLASEDTLYSIEKSLISRKASPISYSIVYFILARIANISIQALYVKGGFIPAYIEHGKPILCVDIFKEGNYYSPSIITHDIIGLRDDKALMIIYLEYLSYVFRRLGEHDKKALIDRALHCFGEERFLTGYPPKNL